MRDRQLDKTAGKGGDPAPIREKLPELRESKGWSRERLSHEAYAIDHVGTSVATIVAIERGTRRPGLQTMAALAMALDADPSVFAEYRLAAARYLLDETRVGLERALGSLEDSRLGAAEIPYDDIVQHSHAGRLAEARDRRRALSLADHSA
jgi:transcriptional regulator with XRE-family HTH domain